VPVVINTPQLTGIQCLNESSRVTTSLSLTRNYWRDYSFSKYLIQLHVNSAKRVYEGFTVAEIYPNLVRTIPLASDTT
jgi:hypothetical protein